MHNDTIVILDNIRSAHNVGSIFRTADGAGVSRIILCGYTPTPIDRFGRTQPQIAKTSLGANSMIAWEHLPEVNDVSVRIEALKAEGFAIVAVEQTDSAIPLAQFSVPSKVAYIFGNEVEGVSRALLDLSNAVIEIPMRGKKESLNVGVAAGIVLFKH